jgi:hypothetical protein
VAEKHPIQQPSILAQRPDKGWRGKWAGRLSGNPSATARPAITLKPVSTRKIDCQPAVLTSSRRASAQGSAPAHHQHQLRKTFADPTASHLSLTTARKSPSPRSRPGLDEARPISHSRDGA